VASSVSDVSDAAASPVGTPHPQYDDTSAVTVPMGPAPPDAETLRGAAAGADDVALPHGAVLVDFHATGGGWHVVQIGRRDCPRRLRVALPVFGTDRQAVAATAARSIEAVLEVCDMVWALPVATSSLGTPVPALKLPE